MSTFDFEVSCVSPPFAPGVFDQPVLLVHVALVLGRVAPLLAPSDHHDSVGQLLTGALVENTSRLPAPDLLGTLERPVASMKSCHDSTMRHDQLLKLAFVVSPIGLVAPVS